MLAAIQSALNLKARQGWIFFLAGGAVLLLKFYEVSFFGNLDPTWIGICGVVFVLGAVILLVSLGGHLFEKAAEAKSAQKRNEENRREFQARLKIAVDNLDVLSDIEQRSLLWIFANGQQRFRAENTIRSNTDLGPKGIILSGDKHSHDIYVVNDAVWALRDSWLKKYNLERLDPKKAPWDFGYF